jgi:glycosyltransferase involved in cell wall biosynthesis
MAFVDDVPPRRPRAIDCVRVAFLGRYHRDKGVYRLLDLWPAFAGQPMRLDFYGHGVEREGLEQEIRRRGLEASVRVNGGWSTSEELASIMAATDLIVLPSETEGLPLVLLEAMAHGVPFVATDVGAVRTLAEDNPDVRVVPLDNVALGRAIMEIAAAVRAGGVSGARLQEYHRRKYGGERISSLWADALLDPQRFWAESREASEPQPRLTPAVD